MIGPLFWLGVLFGALAVVFVVLYRSLDRQLQPRSDEGIIRHDADGWFSR